MENSKLKLTLWYFVGNLFYKGFVLLMMPIYTRVLPKYDYGLVNTYTAWVSILTVLIGMQLCMTMRSAFVDYRDNLEEYINSIIKLSNIFLLIAVIIVTILSRIISFSFILAICCVLQSYAVSIQNIFINKYMMSVQYKRKIFLMIIPNMLSAIISIFFITNLNTGIYLGRILPYVVINLLICIILIVFSYKRTSFKNDKKTWEYALLFALPLVFHGLSSTVLSSSDTIMITHFKGEEETAIYGVVYNLCMSITIISTSMESVWIPWFTKNMTITNYKNINKAAKLYINLGGILISCCILVLPEILKIFCDEKYYAGMYLIPPIALSAFMLFIYSLCVDLEYYYKETKKIAINTIVSACLNIILNLLLIPKFGALAAAYTTLVSYINSFIFHYFTARKLNNSLLPINIYIKPIILTVSISIITSITIRAVLLRWILMLSLLTFIIYSLVRKDYYKDYLNKFRRNK